MGAIGQTNSLSLLNIALFCDFCPRKSCISRNILAENGFLERFHGF